MSYNVGMSRSLARRASRRIRTTLGLTEIVPDVPDEQALAAAGLSRQFFAHYIVHDSDGLYAESYTVKELRSTWSARCTAITSQTSNPTLHAPLLDLDFPCTTNGTMLSMSRSISSKQATRLERVLSRYDLADTVGVGSNSTVVRFTKPVHLVPSRTPGHFHLYVEAAMPRFDMMGVLIAFADAGLVERSFVDAARRTGYALVRVPTRERKPVQKSRF